MLPGRNNGMAKYTPVGTMHAPKPLPATGRPGSIAALWASLGDEDRVALVSNLSDGLVDARWTAMAVSPPGSSEVSVRSMLAALDRAIQELSRAKELLTTRAEAAA